MNNKIKNILREYENPWIELVEVCSEQGFALTIKPGSGQQNEEENTGETDGEEQL